VQAKNSEGNRTTSGGNRTENTDDNRTEIGEKSEWNKEKKEQLSENRKKSDKFPKKKFLISDSFRL
jgi:hypothetical protein